MIKLINQFERYVMLMDHQLPENPPLRKYVGDINLFITRTCENVSGITNDTEINEAFKS